MIDLGSCIAVVDHDSKLNGYKFVLNIIMADFTISHFAASSKEEMDEWIGAMNEFIFTRTTVRITSYMVGSDAACDNHAACGNHVQHVTIICTSSHST